MAADAPDSLSELFATLQHFYWLNVHEESVISDIQCTYSALPSSIHSH